MGWYEAAKDAIKIAQQTDNIPLVTQILELQREMQEMQQENFELKKRIAELEEFENIIVEYSVDRNEIYEIKANGIKEGPYCTRCWEVDKKLVSVHNKDMSTYRMHICPNCKTEVILERKDIPVPNMTPRWDR